MVKQPYFDRGYGVYSENSTDLELILEPTTPEYVKWVRHYIEVPSSLPRIGNKGHWYWEITCSDYLPLEYTFNHEGKIETVRSEEKELFTIHYTPDSMIVHSSDGQTIEYTLKNNMLYEVSGEGNHITYGYEEQKVKEVHRDLSISTNMIDKGF